MGFGNAATEQHSWTVDEQTAREIIKRDLDLGINFFDTAIVYQNGISEQFVGKALRDFAKLTADETGYFEEFASRAGGRYGRMASRRPEM